MKSEDFYSELLSGIRGIPMHPHQRMAAESSMRKSAAIVETLMKLAGRGVGARASAAQGG